MTTTTMTAIAQPAFRLDRAAFWLLLAFVASLQLSIAAAGILLTRESLRLVGLPDSLLAEVSPPRRPVYPALSFQADG